MIWLSKQKSNLVADVNETKFSNPYQVKFLFKGFIQQTSSIFLHCIDETDQKTRWSRSCLMNTKMNVRCENVTALNLKNFQVGYQFAYVHVSYAFSFTYDESLFILFSIYTIVFSLLLTHQNFLRKPWKLNTKKEA